VLVLALGLFNLNVLVLASVMVTEWVSLWLMANATDLSSDIVSRKMVVVVLAVRLYYGVALAIASPSVLKQDQCC
jgi:hypothetical protein